MPWKDKAKQRAYQTVYNKKYYWANRDKILKANTRWEKAHRNQSAGWRKAIWERRRIFVLQVYSDGKMQCACCGEDEVDFLTIDHIQGGGTKHIKRLRAQGYRSLTAWLYYNDFPEGYRVLCWNCNCALGIHGACPHNVVRR